ncbi:uncharacterized protein si:ch211-79m20.1 [Girardinichthys multiradiatus]|uniref:uncharacterized protein si:ch211-79m20.1 n=1 Tax=Girardinichthys multiradiatus TaxID=208333 RepID=UPI001FAD5293|nr:uncharacterized protein si:ch211-79m20.1 [Girardinichthys multiradiatus]
MRLLRLGGNMKSWVLQPLLLAVLLSARLRFGNAEGDPLPQSLVDLVLESPISSVEDLKLLLKQEASSIEDTEDEHDSLPHSTHGRYIRSLVEAQPAQKAECKVRTEVMEITRSMLDRRNADFMLFPPCVEVQRCSGCCNTEHLQCVPTVTSSRYLQVIKRKFINRKPHYENAIISVEDHVSCRCQRSSPSTSSSSSSTVVSQPNPLPPPPQKPPASSHLPLFPPHTPHPLPPKTHASKADLHRHDDLKHNQQHHHPHKHDPLARQWQQGSYTQLVRWTQPRVHQALTHVQTGVRHTTAGLLGSVSTWPSETRAEHTIMGSPHYIGHGSGFDRSREEKEETDGGGVHHTDHEQQQKQLLKHHQRQEHQCHQHPHNSQQYNPGGDEDQELRTQYQLHAPQSDSASPPVSITQAPETGENPTAFISFLQKDSVTTEKYAEVTHHKQIETKADGQKKGAEREESGSAVSEDSARAEAANQGKEKDSKLSGEGGHLTEEERRQKLLEMVQSEPEKTPLLHPHQRPKPTTFKSALSTVAPMSMAAYQVPFRPASPRRRKRKHRKRISKAAMRAMIM